MNELLERFNADNETVFCYEWSFELDGVIISDSFGYDEILLKSGIYKKYISVTSISDNIDINHNKVITRAPTLSLKFLKFNSDEVITIKKIKEFMSINQLSLCY